MTTVRLWIVILVAIGLTACTDAVPEMGWLSTKNNDVEVRFKNQVIYQNEIFISSSSATLLIKGSELFTEFAIAEVESCDTLSLGPGSPEIPIEVSSGDGPKTFSYRYKMNETESECKKLNFNLDTTAPSAVSVASAGDATISGVVYVGASQKVDYTLSAVNVSEMKISENNSCTGGVWEPYKVQKDDAPLSNGEGARSLSVIFRNKFEVLTGCLQTSVVLDTLGPDLTSWNISYSPSALEQTNTSETSQYSWSSLPLDAGIGTTGIEVSLGTNALDSSITSWTVVSGLSGKISGLSLLPGSYYLNFRAVDQLGNRSVYPSRVFKVKPQLPVLSLSTPASSPGQATAVSLQSLHSAGQLINIYDNATCSGIVRGTAFSANNNAIISLNTLSTDGVYNFYGEAVQGGVSSGCTSAPVVYELDRTPPTLNIIRTGVAAGNYLTQFTWKISVLNAATTPYLTLAQVSATGPASNCVKTLTQLDAVSYTFRLSNCTGLGSLGVKVQANSVFDAVGNGNIETSSVNAESALLTNPVSVEFAVSGDSVLEGTTTSAQTVKVKSSGASAETIRVWYQVLSQSTHLQNVSPSALSLNSGFVDILPGSTEGILQYDYLALPTSQGSRSVHLAITSITNGLSVVPTAAAPQLVTIGRKQIFRRGIVASDGSSDVEAVVSGIRHSCLLTPDKKIKCWGRDLLGEIRNIPGVYSKPVFWDEGSGFSYQAVVVGHDFTCGLTDTFMLRCSGDNSKGQFGNETLGAGDGAVHNAGYISGVPAQFSRVAAGPDGVCGISKATSEMYCWGANHKGESSGATFATFISTPKKVNSSIFIAVARGYQHTCGVLQSGQLSCWGDGTDGQIGSVEPAGTVVPTNPDSGVFGYVEVFAGGNTSCAITDTNQLKCWGKFISGTGTYSASTYSSQARLVGGSKHFKSVSIGSAHFCGVIKENTGPTSTSGRVFCYGNNSYGQLGYGEEGGVISSGTFAGLSEYFETISAAGERTCGINAQKIAKCWGAREQFSFIGDGSVYADNTPRKITGPAFLQVSTGSRVSCGISQDNVLYCWGKNSSRVIPESEFLNRMAPIVVDGGFRYKKVSVSSTFACAITTANKIRCWGDNTYGQLGIGNNVPNTQIVNVDSANTYIDISVGSGHVCALKQDNQVRCWGRNDDAQVGVGILSTSVTNPAAVDVGVFYRSISAGDHHTCGVTMNDDIKCWGQNTYNQSGSLLAVNTVPELVTSSSKYSQVSAGYRNTCGVTLTKTLECWGNNSYGQLLGSPVGTGSATPITATGMGTNILSVDFGFDFVCTGNDLNENYCWGLNVNGTLAMSGSITGDSNVPKKITGHFFKTISAGTMSACGLSNSNEISCWGQNTDGGLGDGFSESNYPIAIFH